MIESKVRKTVYRFKYCLAKGIEEVEVETHGTGNQKYGYLVRNGNMTWDYVNILKDTRPTRAGAAVEAEKIRVKKITSLKKQIKKLEGGG